MIYELKVTQDYGLFIYDQTNRPVEYNPKLTASMKQHGFLPGYPLLVVRQGSKLVIKDGQTRFFTARSLSLPVYYVECDDTAISIPAINDAKRRWTLEDYVWSFAQQENADYLRLLTYSTDHNIGIRAAASMMLGGCADSGGNACTKIRNGTFKVKTMEIADVVAMVAEETEKHVSWSRHQGYLGALSRCCFVKEFNPALYVQAINRRPRLLKGEHTCDDFLDMIERAVNYYSSSKMPLAFFAREAARKHSAVKAA